jgi:hypothetical protein
MRIKDVLEANNELKGFFDIGIQFHLRSLYSNLEIFVRLLDNLTEISIDGINRGILQSSCILGITAIPI